MKLNKKLQFQAKVNLNNPLLNQPIENSITVIESAEKQVVISCYSATS